MVVQVTLPRTFYRIIKSHMPTLEDFTSNAEKGRIPRGRELTNPAIHHGLSMYSSQDDAIHVAQRFPKLGNFIAALAIPSDDPDIRIRLHAINPNDSHHTVWCAPGQCLTYVFAIIPVPRPVVE